MKNNLMRIFLLVLIAATLAFAFACSGQHQPGGQLANTNTTTVGPSPEKKSKATGVLTASPNPIKVCDKTPTGVTKLTWSATGASPIEVRIGAPGGTLFARTVASGGTAETGKWIANGTVIYLQDVSGGNPLTPEYTIAKLTVKTTTEGCP